MPLNAGQLRKVRSAIAGASSAAVEDTLASIKTSHLTRLDWLGQRNRYRKHTVSRLTEDSNPASGRTVNSQQLLEYVSASVIAHCFDGWSFLSQAIDSLLDGNDATALHLAYYAELRATMSFLAGEGIGVFNRTHYWFDRSGSAHALNGIGTHTVAWGLLQEWAERTTNSQKVLGLITVREKTLDDWLTAASHSSGATSAVLASRWLRHWSIDLAILSQDHLLRNVVSYRPTTWCLPAGTVHFSTYARKISDFWYACEPAATGGLGSLDLHLLRRALLAISFARTGKHGVSRGYRRSVDSALGSLGLMNDSFLRRFLLKPCAEARLSLLDEASLLSAPKSGTIRPLPVIARALLMLRLASGAIESLLQRAAIGSDDLEFWWGAIGESRGLWLSGSQPDRMADLWFDVEPSLERLTDLMPNVPSNRRAWLDLGHNVWQLRQFERVGLWAIGL